MLRPTLGGERYELSSPTAMPRAAGFLWNRKMMLQVTCRGYAVAQFMQPEPAKYAYAPNLEAKTFMQPEQPYYAHHPGRFFYIKDELTGEIFSAPFEPVRAKLDSFNFSVGKGDIAWVVECLGLRIDLSVSLPVEDVVELWSLKVTNISRRARKLSIYSYFPIGYMSWMNQSAEYRPDLSGLVASCVTPYQKVADYFKNKSFKDKTFFLCEQQPDSWEANQSAFEGEGGLHAPSALQLSELNKGEANYETPAAVVQYRVEIAVDEERSFRFLFGPAFDDAEIIRVRSKYLSAQKFMACQKEYSDYLKQGLGCLQIESPDKDLDNFVNHWLPRQVFYHGDVNRLTTDPQTRNYLQDNMGMCYLKPSVARAAFLHALSQQEANGAMPDGILLSEGAELKYINQIPHADHCVWLPVCLKAYLDETNDVDILDEIVDGSERGISSSVFDRISRAMDWLLSARDHRGLSFIAQGDWCDPMNMVGYKGKGVSGWLSVAAAYALNLWADICARRDNPNSAQHYRLGAKSINHAVNKYLWDGSWFARGITDDNVVFGVAKDVEGRIFLNPQSWAILSGAADASQYPKMFEEINKQLVTPYGVTMFAPAYTAMRDDVGRVTQKYPGSAENGSVYNHAAIFYIFSLYSLAGKTTFGESLHAQGMSAGDIDLNGCAYKLLRQMIPGPGEADYLQRGQLPVFIPNYYRGAYKQYPRTAGRSSQLFNTGTVAWVYRCLVEGLCGLKGDTDGLTVNPLLPKEWDQLKVVRKFRGATFHVHIRRTGVSEVRVTQDGELLSEAKIRNIVEGKEYGLEVCIP